MVSICILSHNKIDLTLKCVESIREHTDQLKTPYEIVILDNGSMHDTVEGLRSLEQKDTKVLLRKDNLGSPKGMNECVKASKGEFIVTLDNDTEVSPHWLEIMLRTMVKGTCYEGVAYAQDVGVVAAYSDQGTYGYQLQKNTTELHEADIKHCALFCALTPRFIWERLGGWDEDFSPGYWEDTYYCYQVKKLGYNVRLAPVWIKHVGGGSFDESRQVLIDTNRRKYYEKIGGYKRHTLELFIPESIGKVNLSINTQILPSVSSKVAVLKEVESEKM